MDLRPKTEPGSPPMLASGDQSGQRNLKTMSISELVSVLRAAFLMDDFDRVEEVLVARDARLRAEIEEKMKEIGSLQEKIEVERMERIQVQEELKKREEQSQKGKRAQESYEKLLKTVKESGFNDKNAINELRNKNRELEGQKRKLEELKKNWVVDKNALAGLRIRNSELEESVKKNLLDDKNAIDQLRTENSQLADEKRRAEALVQSWKEKFGELNERVLKLEDDTTKLLMSGNTEWESLSKANKDALGASARGRLGLGPVIEIEDSDDDECISQGTLHEKNATSRIVAENKHPSSSGAVQQKNLSTGVQSIAKRKLASSRQFDTNINMLDHIDTDTSSSSSDSSDMDHLPLSIRGIKSNKNRKTEADSLGYSLPK